MPETSETTPIAPAPKPAKTARTARKAKAKARASKNVWSDAMKAKHRAAIKSGRQTYVSIAKALGITPQSVWAALNRTK